MRRDLSLTDSYQVYGLLVLLSLNWSSFRFCCFPPFSIIGKSPKRQNTGNIYCSSTVYTTIVSSGNESNHCPSVTDQSQERPVTFTMDTICSSSTAETFESVSSSFLRTARRKIRNLRGNHWALVQLYSWRDSTRSQYARLSSAQMAVIFSERSIDINTPDIADIFSFLIHLFTTQDSATALFLQLKVLFLMSCLLQASIR